jgi:hypothetical protein
MSKVIAASILAATGWLAFHHGLSLVLRRWTDALWAALTATSPVPHWALVLAIVIILVAGGMVVRVVRRLQAQNGPPAAKPHSVAPVKGPAPNFIFLGARSANIEMGLNYGYYEKEALTDVLAVVACFRNEPAADRTVLDADHVTANVVYRDSQGREIGEGISRACWLNSEYDIVDFEVGESHCAILVSQANKTLFAPYKRRQRTNHGTALLPGEYQFGELISSIELRLLSSRKHLLLPSIVFDFSVVGGVPQAVARPGNASKPT